MDVLSRSHLRGTAHTEMLFAIVAPEYGIIRARRSVAESVEALYHIQHPPGLGIPS